MSQEATSGENEPGHATAPSAESTEKVVETSSSAVREKATATAAAVAATSAAVKAAEASKLFDKLFSKSETDNTASRPALPPTEVTKKEVPGETDRRKPPSGHEEHLVQRVATGAGISNFPLNLPEHVIGAAREVVVSSPYRHSDEIAKLKSHLDAQVIPTAADAVVSKVENDKPLIQAKTVKIAAKSEINFPERINNLKSQNDQLRARLAKLE